LEPTALADSTNLSSATKLRFGKDKRVLHSAVQRHLALGAIAMLNVVYEGFLALHGTKKLWIVQMV
jgi:hypothetical protein